MYPTILHTQVSDKMTSANSAGQVIRLPLIKIYTAIQLSIL